MSRRDRQRLEDILASLCWKKRPAVFYSVSNRLDLH